MWEPPLKRHFPIYFRTAARCFQLVPTLQVHFISSSSQSCANFVAVLVVRLNSVDPFVGKLKCQAVGQSKGSHRQLIGRQDWYYSNHLREVRISMPASAPK